MEKFKRGLEIVSKIVKSAPGVRPLLDALQAYRESRVEVLGDAFSGTNSFGNPSYAEGLSGWKKVSVGGSIGRLLNGTRTVRGQDIHSLNTAH